jgi:hypothetical protein
MGLLQTGARVRYFRIFLSFTLSARLFALSEIYFFKLEKLGKMSVLQRFKKQKNPAMDLKSNYEIR